MKVGGESIAMGAGLALMVTGAILFGDKMKAVAYGIGGAGAALLVGAATHKAIFGRATRIESQEVEPHPRVWKSESGQWSASIISRFDTYDRSFFHVVDDERRTWLCLGEQIPEWYPTFSDSIRTFFSPDFTGVQS